MQSTGLHLFQFLGTGIFSAMHKARKEVVGAETSASSEREGSRSEGESSRTILHLLCVTIKDQ